jgi:predicted nucleic acid-binding protein
MSEAEFLDSNVVLYAYDSSQPGKRGIARDLLQKAINGECVISAQVLSEVAAVLLHKISPALPADAVIEILDLLRPIPIIYPDQDTVRRAVQAHSQYGVHFYDGMILAAAERAGCRRILSEDLNAGQEYFGLTVENPFA